MPACVIYFYKVMSLSEPVLFILTTILVDKTNGFYFEAILFLIMCSVFLHLKNYTNKHNAYMYTHNIHNEGGA